MFPDEADEAGFVRGLQQDPLDHRLRLVYADWLEERGESERARFLRAMVEHFKEKPGYWSGTTEALWHQVDRVWAALVNPPPFGILVPGLTFSDSGTPVTRTELARIESHWGEPLPPDYAAFLLLHNGGRPSKPFLWSYADHEDGTDDYYDEVRFYSTQDRFSDGRPYHFIRVPDMFAGHLGEADPERLNRMMPIGTLMKEEGNESVLALLMDQSWEFARYLEIEYSEESGLCESNVLEKESFAVLLSELTERANDEGA